MSRPRHRCLDPFRVATMAALLAVAAGCLVGLTASLPEGTGDGLAFAAGVLLVPLLFSPWEWAMHRYLYHRVLARVVLPVYLTHHRDHHHVFFPPGRFTSAEILDGSAQAHPSVWRLVLARVLGRDLPVSDRWLYFGFGAVGIGGGAWLLTGRVAFLAGIAVGAAVVARLFGYVHGTIHRPGTHPWIEAQPWFPFLRQHHYIHHVDTEANVNFLVPLADWLFGTLRLSLTDEERAGLYRCQERSGSR